MRARLVLSAVAFALPVAMIGMSPAATASAHVSKHVAMPHSVMKLAKHAKLGKHNDSSTSLNWSGYDVNGTGITAVTSTFTVPSAGLLPPGFASTWTGIGGYSTSDLIQAGITEDSLPIGGSTYYAWYEILPASETQLTNCSGDTTCAVAPGDKVSVDIHKIGADLWSVSLSDGSKWSWQRDIHYVSTESSAEWILEAPTFVVQTTVANVGTAYFGPTNTYSDASGTHTIAEGNPTSIAMGPGLINEATPSALAPNGMSFNSCAFQQSCAAPAA